MFSGIILVNWDRGAGEPGPLYKLLLGEGLKHYCLRAQCFLIFAAMPCAAGDPQPATRAAQIQAHRAAKAAHLKPERASAPHRAFRYIQERRLLDWIGPRPAGLGARFGGLGPNSGFAAGPVYIRPSLFGGPGVFRTSFVGSTRLFYSGELGYSLPKLAAGKVSLDFTALRLSFPSVDYYGPGPNSSKSGRTDYAVENTAFETRAALNATPHVSFGGLTRFLRFTNGPGRDSTYASTDSVYSTSTAPGLLVPTNFMSPGVFLDLDWRSFPNGRRDGNRFLAEYSTFLNTGPGSFSFGRVNLDFRRYFALMSGQREILLRANAVLSNAFGSGGVPFYLQPQLGGAYNLRGFRARRFYDNDLTVVNAEYRWEVAVNLDAALFADAGKVFSSIGVWHPFKQLQTSYGFGLRFRRNGEVFLRMDTGFSREGPQFWLSFGDLF